MAPLKLITETTTHQKNQFVNRSSTMSHFTVYIYFNTFHKTQKHHEIFIYTVPLIQYNNYLHFFYIQISSHMLTIQSYIQYTSKIPIFKPLFSCSPI